MAAALVRRRRCLSGTPAGLRRVIYSECLELLVRHLSAVVRWFGGWCHRRTCAGHFSGLLSELVLGLPACTVPVTQPEKQYRDWRQPEVRNWLTLETRSIGVRVSFLAFLMLFLLFVMVTNLVEYFVNLGCK